MTEAEVWIRFMVGAVTADHDTQTAALIADGALVEFNKRYEWIPWYDPAGRTHYAPQRRNDNT